MKRPVIWTRAALGDLRAQIDYIARENPAAARRVAERIRATGAALADFATGHAGRVADTYEKSVRGLPYIIAYLAATGEVFDQGMAAEFPVGGVIPGFSEGLQTMGKGAVARLCIPAALGYGAKATGPIPANADLVFQVELVDILAG